MQETIYVGLDLGSSVCQQSVMNAEGLVRFSRTVLTSEQHLRVAFDKLGGEVRVHMEAGELADWAGSVIGPLVSRVVVSHPRSLAWIGKDSLKDDKIDAGKLAELLRLGRVHEVYRERSQRAADVQASGHASRADEPRAGASEIEDQGSLKDFGRYPQGRRIVHLERPGGFA